MPNDETRAASEPEPRTARVRRHGWLSPIWVVPVVAAALVAYLAWHSLAHKGKLVTLVLATADGLTPEQTQVKHKAVAVGTVESVELSADMKTVVAQVRMSRGTDAMLTEHARFWVVRPRISAGSLSGLETIVSGAYIEVDPGEPGGRRQTQFRALTEPPGRESDEPGQSYVLEARRLGALSTGSPVYYRDVEVGEVLGYDLGVSTAPLTLKVFVRAPFDRLVHPHTRFWNASGLSLSSGPTGMHVEVESLQTLLSGGLAFETPVDDTEAPAPEAAHFHLYDDEAAANDDVYGETIPYVTYFRTSVEGLSKGSAVLLAGVQVGAVSEVRLVERPGERGLIARVAFGLQPERLRGNPDAQETGTHESMPRDDVRRAFTDPGLRVRLESTSILTGTKNLALEYAADGKAVERPREGEAVVLPSSGAGLESITSSLASVADRLDKIPFEQIGARANGLLASMQRLVDDVDAGAGPALAELPGIANQMSLVARNANGAFGPSGYGPNSDFQRGLERMMREMNDAARSFRVLAEYLDRHPEALLRGRASQASGR